MAAGCPNIPIVFAKTRPLVEEWTYRYLAAAHAWASAEPAAIDRITPPAELATLPTAGTTTAEIRSWVRVNGIAVPARGRLPTEVHQAWLAANSARP